MKKIYVIDTDVLLEDENCITILRNGVENRVVILTKTLNDLEKLRSNVKKRELALRAVDAIYSSIDFIEFMEVAPQDSYVVSNDKLKRLKYRIEGLNAEEFQSSKPIQTESELYTGFDGILPNSFEWVEGKPVYHCVEGDKVIAYENEVWRVKPKNVYQNLALELLLDENLDLITLQSKAGLGKTYLALAAALYLVLEKKKHRKIFVVKSPVEIGPALGFLPGDLKEKLDPYYRPIYDLVHKLNTLRPAAKLYADKDGVDTTKFNSRFFEVLPLSHIRGMNIEDAIVIVDEMQNLSRSETRALLTRMCEGTRCFCLGDANQVDNPYLNEFNNGLNWVVSLAKGQPNYGHLVLKGAKSRGPVTDLVLKVGL